MTKPMQIDLSLQTHQKKKIEVDETDQDSLMNLTKAIVTKPKIQFGVELKLGDMIERLEKTILGIKRVDDLFIVIFFSSPFTIKIQNDKNRKV